MIFLVLISFAVNGTVAQRRTRGKRLPSPRQTQTTAPVEEETITVTGTSVNLKHAFAASDYKQAFYVGAVYGSSTPDSAVLSILSISKNYRYEKCSTVEILIDEEDFQAVQPAGMYNFALVLFNTLMKKTNIRTSSNFPTF